MEEVVIVSAVRTAIGNFNGGLSPLSATVPLRRSASGLLRGWAEEQYISAGSATTSVLQSMPCAT
jgi:acetyl-CoA acetyltransferase